MFEICMLEKHFIMCTYFVVNFDVFFVHSLRKCNNTTVISINLLLDNAFSSVFSSVVTCICSKITHCYKVVSVI